MIFLFSRKKNIIHQLFITFLVFASVPASIYSEAVITCPEESSPGGIARVIAVSNTGIDNLRAELRTEKGERIAAFRGFRYNPDFLSEIRNERKIELECSMIIVGFDPGLKSGNYIISVTEGNAGGQPMDFSISLKDRTFRKDIIRLNENLSSLRADDSERRKKETLEIVEIFSTFNNECLKTDSNLMMPLMNNPIVTSFYGDLRSFIYKDGGKEYSVHNGIDFTVETGNPVHCSASGRVVFAGERIITGNSVIVEHLPGLYSIYYHLDRIYVHKDMFLSKGAVIGLTGSTGLSTGPHLHWELRNQMVPVDPAVFITDPMIDKDKIISIINSDFSDMARGR